MQLSSKSLQNAQKASSLLTDASGSIRVLRSLRWDSRIGLKFLADKGNELPQVSYAPIDCRVALGYVKSARRYIDGDHAVSKWLSRSADAIELSASLIQNRGTADFYHYSKELYGTPERLMLDRKTKVIDMAKHIDTTLDALDLKNLVRDGVDKPLNAEDFASALRTELSEHFGAQTPKVVLSDELTAKAAASSKRIRVRRSASFTQMDVRQLLQHEALVHVATALNGRSQDHFSLLGCAHGGTTQIQEGLAVFAEMIAGTMDPVRFRRLADRVIAIQMSVDGADFIDVYKFYLERSDDPNESYENTRRIFRGGLVTGGAPFTKDMVYLNGLLRVHNFLRTVVKLNRADLIRLLFVGKLDLEDVPALASLADMGMINAPTYMPDWANDLRFVVSYLSYSSFLNQIKLPGFQSYYEDMLSITPDVWGSML